MELQLGLSLAIDNNNPIESAGIKNKGLEAKEREGLKTLSSTSVYSFNKRRFQEAFGKTHEASQGLPLRLWSGQPNDGDEWNKEENSCSIEKINEDEEDYAVGWPPIKSWRRKVLHQHGRIANTRTAVRNENGGSNSSYIKVKMEGEPIARKINLRHYQSYQTLTDSLISMFSGGCRNVEKDVSRYMLAYQDRDGDWLLAGSDVPWQTFITSVQRLEMVRKDGRTGLQ